MIGHSHENWKKVIPLRENVFGLFIVEPGMLIGSFIIVLIGAAVATKFADRSGVAAIGWLVAAIGVLAVLQSVWISGLREINLILSIVTVIVLGIALVRRVPGIAATLGGIAVVILAVLALNRTPLAEDLNFQWGGRVSAAFERGFDSLADILSFGDAGGDGPRGGQNDRNGRAD